MKALVAAAALALAACSGLTPRPPSAAADRTCRVAAAVQTSGLIADWVRPEDSAAALCALCDLCA